MWLDESLGVSGLRHFQLASLDSGRSKVQENALGAGRLMNGQRCWPCLGTTRKATESPGCLLSPLALSHLQGEAGASAP